MNVSIGERWEGFVEEVVKSGRYGSASEVVREGLRLVEEREAKLKALRDTIEASIARGGSHSSEDVVTLVKSRLAKLDIARGKTFQLIENLLLGPLLRLRDGVRHVSQGDRVHGLCLRCPTPYEVELVILQDQRFL